MESAKERLKGSIQKQDGIDKALENLGQTVKQAIEDHRTWADSEVQRCYRIIASLTGERDLAVEQLIKAKKIITRIKEDLT